MITYNIINNNIVGSINGEDFAVKYTKEKYDALMKGAADLNKAQTFEQAKDLGDKLLESIQGDVKSQIEEVSDFLSYDPNTKEYHLKQDGNVSPIPLPTNLVDKLKYAIDKELPVDPLIKFYSRILRNPRVYNVPSLKDAQDFLHEVFDYIFQTFVSPTLFKKFVEEDGLSEEVAREMATVPQTPITMEGLLLTKKVVNIKYDRQRYRYELNDEGEPTLKLRDGVEKTIDEDSGEVTIEDPKVAEDWVFEPAMMGSRGDAFFSGEGEDAVEGHEIRIGQRVWHDSWSKVDCDPRNSCRKGHHVGNQTYIDGWENSENATLNVALDPADIGCAPYAQSGPDAGVLRTKGYMPLEFKDRTVDNRNMYHTSDYAAKKDAEWAKIRSEAIEELNTKLEEVQKEVEERKNLLPA